MQISQVKTDRSKPGFVIVATEIIGFSQDNLLRLDIPNFQNHRLDEHAHAFNPRHDHLCCTVFRRQFQFATVTSLYILLLGQFLYRRQCLRIANDIEEVFILQFGAQKRTVFSNQLLICLFRALDRGVTAYFEIQNDCRHAWRFVVTVRQGEARQRYQKERNQDNSGSHMRGWPV